MPVTQIIDRTTYLEIYTSATEYDEVPKDAVKLRRIGDVVFLYDRSQSNAVIEGGTPQQYRLLFASITNPASATAALLVTNILALLNTGTTMSGYATAANQVIEQGKLDTINTSINGLKGNPAATLEDIRLWVNTDAVYNQRVSDGLSTALQSVTGGEGFATLALARADYNTWRGSVSVIVTVGFPQFVYNGTGNTYGWVVLYR